jgi:hypothetical protein
VIVMTEFKPCPSHRGYETTICGIVRKAEGTRVNKAGNVTPVASKVLTRVGRKLEYVTLKGDWVKVAAMVEDAWTVTIEDEDRPVSSYKDGRIITLHQWYAMMRSREAI